MVQPLTFDQIQHDWVAFTRHTSSYGDVGWRVVTRDNSAVFITDAALAALDTALPAALTYHDKWQNERACEFLQYTLTLWLTPQAFLPVPNEPHLRLARIESVQTVREDAALVSAEFWGLKQSIVVPGRSYVLSVGTIDDELSFTWLETHYPGSVQRLKTAAGLELTGRMLHDYVFTGPAPVVSIALPEQLATDMGSAR